MNPEDLFCFNCGAPKGKMGQAAPTKVVTVPQVEVGYEQQVLRGLQEELSVQQSETSVPQTVVEKPMGSQGSFTLVSAPSPNKIRTPAKQPLRAGLKLPIKPA